VAGAEAYVSGFRVPKGTRIMLSAQLAHHDSNSFPDPARFQPERFLEGRPPPYAFVPFGGGSRRCPGAAIALEQMRIVLGVLLSRFEIERAHPSSTRPIFRGSTLAPADGTRVVLRARR
jgi:cytochrome P450